MLNDTHVIFRGKLPVLIAWTVLLEGFCGGFFEGSLAGSADQLLIPAASADVTYAKLCDVKTTDRRYSRRLNRMEARWAPAMRISSRAS